MIKNYLVDHCDAYTIDFRQSDGTVKLFALKHPPNPYGGGVTDHHLYSTDEICVAAGHEPQTMDEAIAIALYWCEGWSAYIRTGRFPKGTKRYNL